MATTALQDHHVISTNIAKNDDVLKLLASKGLFNVDDTLNRLNLPSTQELAAELGAITPHSGGPLASYESGVGNFLEALQNSPDFTAAQAGNQAALQRLAASVTQLRDAMKIAILNGDLFTNNPAASTGIDPNARNATFFADVGGYAERNAARISAVNALQTQLGGDAAKMIALDTSEKVTATLAYSKANNLKLTRNLPFDPTSTNGALPTAPAELERFMDARGITLSVAEDAADVSSIIRNVTSRQAGFVTTGFLKDATLGAAGVLLTTGEAMGTYVRARAQGETVLSADLQAGKVALEALAVGALIGVAGEAAAPVLAAVAASVLIKSVADSAWNYLAKPVGHLGNALSAGDLSDAVSAASEASAALVRWVQDSVTPFVQSLQADANAFAADPAGYLDTLAQKIWTGTKGALQRFISNTDQFLNENSDQLMQLLDRGIQQTMPGEAALATQTLGSTQAALASTVGGFASRLVQTPPATLDNLQVNADGSLTMSTHRGDAGLQSTVSLNPNGHVTVAAQPTSLYSAAGSAVQSFNAGQQFVQNALSSLTALSQNANQVSVQSAINSEINQLFSGMQVQFDSTDWATIQSGGSVSLQAGPFAVQVRLANGRSDGNGGITGEMIVTGPDGSSTVYDDSVHLQPMQVDRSGLWLGAPQAGAGPSVGVSLSGNAIGGYLSGIGTNAIPIQSVTMGSAPGEYTISGSDAAGLRYQFTLEQQGTFELQTTATTGSAAGHTSDITGNIADIASFGVGAGLTLRTTTGGQLQITDATGVAMLGSANPVSAGSNRVDIGTSAFDVGSGPGSLGTVYGYDSSGALSGVSAGYLGQPLTGSLSDVGNQASNLLGSVNTQIPMDAATGTIDDSLLGTNVHPLDVAGQQPPGTGGDGSPLGSGNLVFATGDTSVSAAGQAGTDLASESSSSIASGNWRPYYQSILGDFNDVPGATGLFNNPWGLTGLPGSPQVPIYDLVPGAVGTNPTPSYTDPLLIDLAGTGIGVTNWIKNPVYFDTNVLPIGNGTAVTPDGMEHETAWMGAGTAMLVFEAKGVASAITNITQTVSEFLNAGSSPGHYADGLAALAALTQAGATSFSASTSLTDATTGVSYWNEIMVWNDANHNGVSDAGEIVSLGSLGITSISLVGSGNKGENLNGSAVTNRTFYTKADGSTGQAAAVNFQNDSIGNVATTASGGIVIRSQSEGGPTQASTFVAQATSAHQYVVKNGTLTDSTSGQQVATGLSAILSSTQSDTITVAADDTGTYWLGGGTGADTLTGGGGTNVFLVNGSTVVHGGTGANSFNIAKVVGNKGVTLDLAKSHLNEVIGGSGGDILNASGTTWNVFIQAGSGNNIIIGGAATDAISGGTGDDLIVAGTGGSVIHAGSGNDVIYGGNATTNRPADVNAGDASNAAFVERLYNGGLGREADAGGFAGFLQALNAGTKKRVDVASDFLNSTEWLTHYGAQSDAQFVTSMFVGFVGRSPAASELNQFTSALASGQSRATILETIADSTQSQHYWGARHPGASDVIYGGPGRDTVIVGTHNTVVYDGTGTMTVVGNAAGFSVLGLHGSYADYSLKHNADGTWTLTDSVAGRDGAVTFSNVAALDFNDISQVSVANGLGMPVNDRLNTGNASQVTVNGSGQFVIQAATLLANDKDYAGNALSIRELLDNNGQPIARGASGVVNGGTVSLSADGSTITFTRAAGFGGVMSFRYHVSDSRGQSGMLVQQVGTGATAEMTATAYLNTPSQPTDSMLDSEWFLQAADVMPVWQDYTGAGVHVGVFDPSGNVDFRNPDLSINAGQSFKSDRTPGVGQLGTHATLVAGVIGAARNGSGAVGVAYDATIDSEAIGNGTNASLAPILDWGRYDVVNNSWVNSALFFDNALTNPAFGQAYASAAKYGRGGDSATGQTGLGTVIVFAGGNARASGDNTNYHSESNSRYAINVGGINAPSDLGSLQISGAPFSNPGSSLLVSAPANNISSTGIDFRNDYGQTFGASYQTTAGTSFAAPIVSGIVALMLQANSTLGYRDIQTILADSAVEVDPAGSNWAWNGATNWNGGGMHTSEDYGFGEVDARAAVRLAETWQRQSTAANEKVDSVALGQTSTTPKAAALNVAIPLDQGVASTQTQSFVIANDAAHTLFVEHAEVEVDLLGVNPNNLIVKLISPSGVVSTLANKAPATLNAPGTTNPQNFAFTFDSVRDYGETAAGTWKVEVAYAPGTVPQGTIAGLALNLYGSAPDGGRTFIYTDEFASLGTGSRAIVQDASGQPDTINVAATTGAARIDLVAGSTDSTIDGRSLQIGSTTHVDTAFLGDGGGTLIGNNDGNTLVAGRGAATIIAGNGNNAIYGGGTNGIGSPTTHDKLTGGSGNDVFYLGTASADVNGGAGTNTIDFQFARGAVTVDLMKGTGGGAAVGDTFSNIQGFNGSAYDDTVIGWGGKTFDGGAGTNTLDYSSANAAVTVNFAAGTAQVGSLSADTIGNFQNVIGSAGDDYFADGVSLRSVDGGAGSNALDFSQDTSGVTIDLTKGTGTNGYGNALTIRHVQTVFGAAYSPNTLIGASDTVALVGSNYGGDHITANNASTVVTFRGSSSGVRVNLATGVNTGGAAQGDLLTNVETVVGSSYSDTITGDSRDNAFDGFLGNDTLTGGGGYDTYYFASLSGYGHDTIVNGDASSNQAKGELDLGTGGSYDVLPSSIWLQRSGNDLVVDVLGTSSQVTIKGWYANAYNQLARIVASDGETIGTQAIGQLQQAMANFQSANPTFNPQSAGQAMPGGLAAQIASDWSAPATSAMSQSARSANSSVAAAQVSNLIEAMASFGAPGSSTASVTPTDPVRLVPPVLAATYRH